MRPRPSPVAAAGSVGKEDAIADDVGHKSANVADFKENVPTDVKISEKEVQKSVAPELREEKWAQGAQGEAARTLDDISPKSQPKSAQGDEMREKMDEIKDEMEGGGTGEHQKVVNAEGQVLNGAEAMAAESLVSMTEQHNPAGIPIPARYSASRVGHDDVGQVNRSVAAKSQHENKPGEEMREKMDEIMHDMDGQGSGQQGQQTVKKPVGIPIPIPIPKKSSTRREKQDKEAEHDDLGQVKGPVREKWAKGTEGESARNEGGVSPKSVRIGSAVMSVADAGYGKDPEEGYITKDEADKEVAEQNAAQRRTEKWVKGTEGEEARMEGNVSPKSVRVGSAVMSLDGVYIGSQEGTGSMRSARSHIGEVDREKMDGESMKSARSHVEGGKQEGEESDEVKAVENAEEQVANAPGGLAELEVDEEKTGESAEEQLANGPGGMAG